MQLVAKTFDGYDEEGVGSIDGNQARETLMVPKNQQLPAAQTPFSFSKLMIEMSVEVW